MQLKSKNAVITGSNQGFGKAIAEEFIAQGANVLICARNEQLLESTRLELSKKAAGFQKVYGCQVDVADRESLNRLYKTALKKFGKIDILVNNAGVYGPKGVIEEIDWDEWVEAININLLGTVLACKIFIPHFKNNGHGKIINLSGGGATAPLPRISAYAASKAAVVRFTETIAEELKDTGVEVNCIAPGALNTRLLDEVLEAGLEKVGKTFYERSLVQKQQGGTPLVKGAELCVFLASDKSNGITGKLISAVWDPWDELPEHLEDLKNSDVYTLRRIVPKDRGIDWGDV
ncbi:MAG: SDR family oxidoreductase [Candidatus Methanoperedens sp.]|nr:SDR family NAD(P)-dependent oxidoreductase [Candidatus Methanoperedens sp.]MCZ7394890.1 SDR family NAD(P)-dependent oxidoreductase [Candidatus Methanoperedens sp.]